MSSTYVSLYYHIVFSTKNRAAAILDPWRPRLHGFMGGVVRKLGVVADSIGGTPDHVHVLMGLKATHRLSDVMRELKAVSSAWVHDEIGERAFKWQDGYGAFTASGRQLDGLRRYIETQEEHHRRKSFEEEYLALLRIHNVEYDPRYLW